jgi:CCR4-NOT transcriptional complex subunit CAF120
VEPSRKTVESNEPTSYPSSFAKNTRSEERTAAAQVAQLEQQAAATRPGKSSNGKGKQRAWQDSDDDEEEEEDDLESDNDGREIPLHHPQPVSPFNATTIQQQGRYSQIPPASFGAPRDTYYSTVNEPAFDQQSQYYDDQSERGGTPPPASGMVPSMSKYGLLHAGLLDKADRSARAVEAQAREVGGPLVSLPSKPPPPQTGLVGAITSHQREKERTGGVGKALTEQQRDRRLAEQRQKQLDDLQREQLMQQQQQMQFQQQQMQQQQFYNPMMNPMMFGGGGMQSPGGMGMMNGQQMDPAMMQQAMMAAQQAFMQAMMQQYQQPSPNNTLIGQQQQNFMPQYFPQQQQQQQQQPYPSSSPLPQSPSLQQSFANAPYQRSSQDYEERATTPVRSAGFGAPERRDSPLRRTESPRRQDDQ